MNHHLMNFLHQILPKKNHYQNLNLSNLKNLSKNLFYVYLLPLLSIPTFRRTVLECWRGVGGEVR
jgi:hypothetical protein